MSAPVLPGSPQGDYNLWLFYSLIPRGAPEPLFLELHKNVSCREARGLLGPWAPHSVCLSLILCPCPVWFCLFFFGKWRRPFCGFYVVLVS